MKDLKHVIWILYLKRKQNLLKGLSKKGMYADVVFLVIEHYARSAYEIKSFLKFWRPKRYFSWCLESLKCRNGRQYKDINGKATEYQEK